jgi:hypothetical protein
MGAKWFSFVSLLESFVLQGFVSSGVSVMSGCGSLRPHQNRRFQWVGVVLTTDSTDGHRYDAFYVWFRSHLCPSVESVVKTGLSFDINLSTTSHSRGAIIP